MGCRGAGAYQPTDGTIHASMMVYAVGYPLDREEQTCHTSMRIACEFTFDVRLYGPEDSMTPDMTGFIDSTAAEAKKASGSVRVTNTHLAAAAGVAVGSETTFCKLWPIVKEGLQLLKNIVPIFAKWIIDAVIAIGDKICA